MDCDEIRNVVQRINETWIMYNANQFAQRLDDCFHPDIVFRGPQMQALAQGKEACIQSYVDFVGEAQVNGCTFSTPEVDVAGDTAVASYSWKVRYTREGEEQEDSGYDVFAFTRSDGRWLATWRTMIMAQADNLKFEMQGD